MPPKRSTTPKTSYTPAHDHNTYKDLLLFEERLKTTAAMLKKRKTRYQLFLLQLCAVIFISASDFILDTYILITPINWVLGKVKPPYGPISPIRPHAYLAPAVLLVAATTLFLFFSNGLYSEKIGYANRYVTHANRTLRSFNMHLNMRPRPISSMRFLSFLRGSSNPISPPMSPPLSPRRTTVSSDDSNPPRSPSATRSTINPIPPPTNPRGELIFNSRVERPFREAYEKYRAAFEKAREERARVDREARMARSWWRWFLLKGRAKWPTPTAPATPTSTAGDGIGTPRRGRLTRTPSGSRANTPHGSRKASPAGTQPKRRSANINPDGLLESVPERKPLLGELRRTPTPSLVGSVPPSPATGGDDSDASTTPSLGEGSVAGSTILKRRNRGRTESFSFLLGQPGSPVED